MLKTIICTSLLMSSTIIYAATATIPSEFHGDWDISQKICDDVNKQIVDSETRIEIAAAQIMTYREICKVASVGKANPNSVTGVFTCMSNDEDTKLKRNFNLNVSADGKLTWNKTNYVKCAAPKKELIKKATVVAPLCTYTAKISEADKKNSSGVTFALTKNISTVAAIIRQDRANYHQFNVRDKEDQSDCVFADKDKRASIEKGFGDTAVASDLISLIVEQNPVLSITVFDNGQLSISKK